MGGTRFVMAETVSVSVLLLGTGVMVRQGGRSVHLPSPIGGDQFSYPNPKP